MRLKTIAAITAVALAGSTAQANTVIVIPYGHRDHPETVRIFSSLCRFGDGVDGMRVLIITAADRQAARDGNRMEFFYVQSADRDPWPVRAIGQIADHSIELSWREANGDSLVLYGEFDRIGINDTTETDVIDALVTETFASPSAGGPRTRERHVVLRREGEVESMPDCSSAPVLLNDAGQPQGPPRGPPLQP